MVDVKKSICVVEDNDAIRKLFVIILERAGYSVQAFSNGEDAVQWLADNQPDILLCDIVLPEMNGSDVMTLVRSFPHGATMKIIALTAHARQGDRERFLDEGFDGYMSKPIHPPTFADDIKAITEL